MKSRVRSTTLPLSDDALIQVAVRIAGETVAEFMRDASVAAARLTIATDSAPGDSRTPPEPAGTPAE